MPRVRPRPAPPPMPDRPGRWKMLLRRQRRLLRPTAFASIAVAGVLVFVVLAHLVGQGPSLRQRMGAATADLGLTVQNIVIEGRDKTPESALKAAIGVAQGAPILTFSVSDARARIEQIAWVRSAVVERVLPGTIRIVLNERRPFAVWQNQGKFALIDRAGNVVTSKQLLDRPLQEIDMRLPDRFSVRPIANHPCGQTHAEAPTSLPSPAHAAIPMTRKAT